MMRFFLSPLACLGMALAFGCGPNLQGAGEDTNSVFGNSTASEAALVGVLYDMKQTPNHEPSNVDAGLYCKILGEFVNKGWDEAVLNRYYRVSRPLYTTQIFIPNMDASLAPKAFGVQKLVKPSEWFIHYKGQVSPPSAGTYRFWGVCDDAMAAAVDGKTILVGCRGDTQPYTGINWTSTEPLGAQAADDQLVAGDWFTVKEGEIIDLDVIIGERPGGLFSAFLMIEKKGQTYVNDPSGHPMFPIFQVAPFNTKSLGDTGAEPYFAKGFPPWKCWQ